MPQAGTGTRVVVGLVAATGLVVRLGATTELVAGLAEVVATMAHSTPKTKVLSSPNAQIRPLISFLRLLKLLVCPPRQKNY